MKDPKLSPTSLRLEQLALGEAKAKSASQHPTDDQAVVALQHSNVEILQRYPPPQVAEEISRRMRQMQGNEAIARRRRLLPWVLVGLPAAAALLLTLEAPREVSPQGSQTSPEITRVKGLAPQLHIHRKRTQGAEKLPAGAFTRAGDLLMLSYVAGDQPYGMILSLDGGGTITFHLPQGGGRAASLDASGENALPNSYELDNAPNFERFFFVTGLRPFSQDDVTQAVQVLANDPDHGQYGELKLPTGLRVTSVLLTKVTP